MRRPTARLRTARLSALRTTLDQRASASSVPRDLLAWVALVPEPKTGPLDFVRFPFQRELYAEGTNDREVVVMKGTQVGISTWALRWVLFHADHGRTGLYVFPTRSDVLEFSAARIKRVISGSPYLRSRRPADGPNARGLIALGGGLVYFRGSEAERGLDSIDADVLVFDEHNTLNQENIEDAERRITSPTSAGLIRRVGVPSVPGFGIAALYERSDQRRWHVRCEACTEWQFIDFFVNVDVARARIVCRGCRKPLDVARGEWVAAFPDRDVRGYHVSRLIAPNADLAGIIAASRKRAGFERERFFNKDLGVPYEPADGRLSLAVLQAAQSAGNFRTLGDYTGDGLVTMGVDVASTRDLHVRISEHLAGEVRRGIFIGTVDGFEDLDELMDRFGVHLAAIDHLPEGRLARAFAARHPGRVYLVAYNTAAQPRGPTWIAVDDEMHFATMRRLETIDLMIAAFRAQLNLLPRDLPDEYFAHLRALARVVTSDEFGNQRVTYQATGADDFAQAEAYDVVASVLWEHRQLVGEAHRQLVVPLDDILDFRRSSLGDYSADDVYSEGFADLDEESLRDW